MPCVSHVLKVALPDPEAEAWTFRGVKTMYGGKAVRAGDTVYVFASEHDGGAGLVARAVVTAAEAVPPEPGSPRQTPRVHLALRAVARPRRRLGRAELKPFTAWGDGRPETELQFKFYRQATNKLGGISEAAAAFLDTCF